MIKLKILHAAVCGVLFLGNAMTHAWAGPIGYLGPAGSWTHQACLDLFGASDLVPLTRDDRIDLLNGRPLFHHNNHESCPCFPWCVRRTANDFTSLLPELCGR